MQAWAKTAITGNDPKVTNEFTVQRDNALRLFDAAYYSGTFTPVWLNQMYRIIENKHANNGSGYLIRDLITDLQVMLATPANQYIWLVYNSGTAIQALDQPRPCYANQEYSSVLHWMKERDNGHACYMIDTTNDRASLRPITDNEARDILADRAYTA